MIEAFYSDDATTLYCGDCRQVLTELPADSVQTCVTSPPYFGLRSYGIGVENGEIGLESTPEAFVAAMVEVFREVRRVLRKDGTVWINLGDSYGHGTATKQSKSQTGITSDGRIEAQASVMRNGLQSKQLLGIPWRVAFALQADGWYLRQDIIWAKPNPMPESVTDRCTKAHEYIFLLAKGQWKTRVVQFSDLECQRFHFSQYFRPNGLPVRGSARLPIDLASAIFDGAESQNQISLPPLHSEVWQQLGNYDDSDFVRGLPEEHRAAVWAARFLCARTTAEEFMRQIDSLGITHRNCSHLLKGRAFATTGLDTPSITSNRERAITIHYPGEICEIDFVSHTVKIRQPNHCSYFYDADAIREPQVEPGKINHGGGYRHLPGRSARGTAELPAESMYNPLGRNKRSVWTVPTFAYPESHFATFPPDLIKPCILAGAPSGGVVLDPFSGSGTTVATAKELGRKGIGIELNPDYLKLHVRRLQQECLPL